MQWIDWTIVGGLLFVLMMIAYGTSKLTKSVSDFLAANRCAGRYLLTMAQGMAGLGAISIAAHFEQFYEAGFCASWWNQILAPVLILVALSGFVIYRFRETRALTMAQFLEIRYSRKFRIFAGMLAWTAGVINYGIFPAVTGRFLIHFMCLPVETSILGFTLPTLVLVMAIMLSIALFMTLMGGQIAVMLTDFFQGQYVSIVALVVLATLFHN